MDSQILIFRMMNILKPEDAQAYRDGIKAQIEDGGVVLLDGAIHFEKAIPPDILAFAASADDCEAMEQATPVYVAGKNRMRTGHCMRGIITLAGGHNMPARDLINRGVQIYALEQECFI